MNLINVISFVICVMLQTMCQAVKEAYLTLWVLTFRSKYTMLKFEKKKNIETWYRDSICCFFFIS